MVMQAHVVDGYKLSHIEQYAPGTSKVYSNLTPRSARLATALEENRTNKIVFFGLQYVLTEMQSSWEKTFFNLPKEEAMRKYSRRLKHYLGMDNGNVQIAAMAKLHDLGYLPIEVRALPEGARVGMGIPLFTVQNTHPDFFWLTNYLETYLSCQVWSMCNAASLSEQYWLTSKRFAGITGATKQWLDLANHCFAARGHRGVQDAMTSGMANLLFSKGTDTLWAIDGVEEFYGADVENEFVAVSVNAFEHATATQRIAYFGSERESIRDIVENIYPRGIVSYVSDSEDYYRVIAEDAMALKDEILGRQEDSMGLCKFVFRPDSSPKTPLEVICGDPDAEVGSYESKGSLQILWDIFGGSINEKGFKIINPKVGLIYGEAIDLEMQDKIYKTMVEQGWCVSNLYLGVGSWGFLKNSSRDSYSIAIKGTSSIVDGREVSMQKNPKTAAATKKSAKGLLRVDLIDGEYVLKDQCTPEEEAGGELKVVFKDGLQYGETTLQDIRQRLVKEE